MSDNTIKEFKHEYFFLSNMFPCSVVYNGLKYLCAESAFQAAKFDNLFHASTTKMRFANIDGYAARVLGKNLKLSASEISKWNERRNTVMEEILRIKFAKGTELANRLIDTADVHIIENNCWHDQYWGNCVCPRHEATPGKNKLGELLMKIRQDLLSNQ